MTRIETATSIVVSITIVALAVVVALPGISTITNEPGSTKNQRNAQNFASVYNSAVQFGADFGDRNDVQSMGEFLRYGVNGTGSYASAEFLVDISPEDLELAEPLLIYDHENQLMKLKTEAP